ncbi:MAG: hypothetical protein JSS53_03845 [Proteobacteria bacterium]|nr:hypothetical protein [Pseudomonadota bacterium]
MLTPRQKLLIVMSLLLTAPERVLSLLSTANQLVQSNSTNTTMTTTGEQYTPVADDSSSEELFEALWPVALALSCTCGFYVLIFYLAFCAAMCNTIFDPDSRYSRSAAPDADDLRSIFRETAGHQFSYGAARREDGAAVTENDSTAVAKYFVPISEDSMRELAQYFGNNLSDVISIWRRQNKTLIMTEDGSIIENHDMEEKRDLLTQGQFYFQDIAGVQIPLFYINSGIGTVLPSIQIKNELVREQVAGRSHTV